MARLQLCAWTYTPWLQLHGVARGCGRRVLWTLFSFALIIRQATSDPFPSHRIKMHGRKVAVIIAGHARHCNETEAGWQSMRNLSMSVNVDMYAVLQNASASRALLQIVQPKKHLLLDEHEIKSEIRRLIPWVHEFHGVQGIAGNMVFTQGEPAGHTASIMYRRYRALKLFDPVHYGVLLVVRPDHHLDVAQALEWLPSIHSDVVVAETSPYQTADSFVGGNGCPNSINDHWLAGSSRSISALLHSFPRLAVWHQKWENDSRFWRWWEHSNTIEQGKFFLNAEGVHGKSLQELKLSCKLVSASGAFVPRLRRCCCVARPLWQELWHNPLNALSCKANGICKVVGRPLSGKFVLCVIASIFLFLGVVLLATLCKVRDGTTVHGM